ncbi:alpha/beta fold hydrolase [Bradyrhizobium sp. Ash2021]|uniref:alpha/beta fold hydrolase n=1 Tax=Bradyrhizobium sp. Ash2021 TaxID=2954771 RepID=UPI00281517F5|nr:alpha/beta fold hydrolase [Bradyrhizobium sp. Ash2021]WMT73527.1 alpha/beta fold hydrolase [Bradyrhizobium sp. Ash2021]
MKRLIQVAVAAATLSTALVCDGARAAQKPTVALVHGAWEESNVWGNVAPKLRADGYRVVVITMPGRPSDPFPLNKVSLDLYRDTILNSIDKERHPVVLVGHSFAGMTISAVAETAPSKIKTLVYLAAYLPKDGQSLLDLGNSDKDSKIGPFLKIMKDQGIAVIDRSGRADLFCNLCSPQLRAAIPNLIVDEPLAPLVTPVHLTADRFGKVDKVYVHTARDVVVSPSLQASMVTATPVRLELTLDTGHTAFLTDPDGLVAAIEKAASPLELGSGAK